MTATYPLHTTATGQQTAIVDVDHVSKSFPSADGTTLPGTRARRWPGTPISP
ncbi:hypothetical protein [Frankia sp. CiP3]|uniref:hypothetical protein n=1 Tax=Frankia sp. CiP3 TaxID=2880971 RepID=UPI001EF5FEB7|nr:hypothetical protein [Frankia sp. CiP3]